MKEKKMGKFGCSCDHVISDVACPNEVTGFALSDKSHDEFSDAISDVIHDFFKHKNSGQIDEWRSKHFNEMYPKNEPPEEMIRDVLTNRFINLTLSVLECDSCGRLWIQEAPDLNKYHAYSPDDDAGSRIKVLGLNQSDR